MQAILDRIPADDMTQVNGYRAIFAVGLADLDARIARARKDRGAEIAHWRRGVELQDGLNYMEPPDWHYSLREPLGGALLRGGEAAEAEEVFRKDLALNPRNGRSLFGLLEALKAQQKRVSIEWVEREFGAAWKHAGASLRIPDL
jgi:hypothetical protein